MEYSILEKLHKGFICYKYSLWKYIKNMQTYIKKTFKYKGNIQNYGNNCKTCTHKKLKQSISIGRSQRWLNVAHNIVLSIYNIYSINMEYV